MIVAIESASTDLSLALAATDGRILASDGWTSDRRGGHELLPRLLALLAGHGRTLDEARALAVGIGPGSFTGLRVGMGLAKGLAFALRRPLVGVPSLEAWLDAEPEMGAAAARAGSREAYLLPRGEPAARIADRDELQAAIGNGGVVAPAELSAAFGLARTRQPLRAAAAVARRASVRLAVDPGGDDLARLEPMYLRAPRGIGPEHVSEPMSWP